MLDLLRNCVIRQTTGCLLSAIWSYERAQLNRLSQVRTSKRFNALLSERLQDRPILQKGLLQNISADNPYIF